MLEAAQGLQIAQVRPPTAGTPVTAYTCGEPATEITLVVCCNTTAGAVKARLFHDDDGSTFDQTTALWYDKAVPANETIMFVMEAEGGGLTMKKDGTIGVGSDTNNALTFTIYGVTATLAQRVSGGRI